MSLQKHQNKECICTKFWGDLRKINQKKEMNNSMKREGTGEYTGENKRMKIIRIERREYA